MAAKTMKNNEFYCYFAIYGSKNVEKRCVLLLLCYSWEQKHWKTLSFIAIYYILDVKGGAVWGPGKWDGGRQPGKSPFDKEILKETVIKKSVGFFWFSGESVEGFYFAIAGSKNVEKHCVLYCFSNLFSQKLGTRLEMSIKRQTKLKILLHCAESPLDNV